jgi:hypothetical protein
MSTKSWEQLELEAAAFGKAKAAAKKAAAKPGKGRGKSTKKAATKRSKGRGKSTKKAARCPKPRQIVVHLQEGTELRVNGRTYELKEKKPKKKVKAVAKPAPQKKTSKRRKKKKE